MKKTSLLYKVTFMLLIVTAFNPGQSGPQNLNNKKISLIPEKRQFADEEFMNPSLSFRPMPMLHNADKEMVYKSKQLGYGGVVTNVSFDHYLRSDEKWKDFENLTKYIIDSLGMHMWIYDELGYPSGSAGGLVLKDNPELQAKGIVCLTALSVDTGNIKIEKPYGHLLNIAAYAYKGTTLNDIDFSSCIDISKFLDSGGNLIWPSPGKGWIAVCIYSKNFYEGTHATCNWVAKRRYIDLLKKEPVRKFINVTYQKYFDYVGKYFGKGIDAFFTDEPSLMGTYFNPPPVKPVLVDTPNVNIPLLPAANFSDGILSDFKTRRGYALNQFLPMLFGDDSVQAQKIRWDYYKTLSELVSENYTGQIGRFCSLHNIAMSGHLLLEEDIMMHPVFEGDFLQIYKNMQYPGIDLLTSHPETALEWACTTAKQASSAAHFDNRGQIMSEVSDAFDQQKGDIYGRIGAIAVQYALGVSHINSYYSIDNMSKDENELFTNTIGRFGYMLNGGKHAAGIAVYYPIEGIWTQTFPPKNLNSFNGKAADISSNFKLLSLQLLNNQLDYDYLDYKNLSDCSIVNGKITTPSGEQYSVFIMPQTPAIDSKTIDFLLKAANNNVKIIMQNSSDIITESGADRNELIKKYEELRNNKNTKLCNSLVDVVNEIEKVNIRDIKLKDPNSKIIYLKKQFVNSSVYMLVNISDSESNLEISFRASGKKIKLWDPFTGKTEQIKNAKSVNDNLVISGIKIGAEKAVFVTFE